jgi:hypothetical protein
MRKFALPAVVLLFCAASVHAEEVFTGTWETTFGALTMTQKGKKVTGTYYDGKAKLEGTVSEGKLTFNYQEKKEGGEGEFTLSRNGKTFTGRYRVAGTKKWLDWNGTRK